MYVHRSINIGIMGVFSGFIPIPVVFLFAAVDANLLQTAVTAVNVRVVVQSDRGTVAPGPVDFDIKREELLFELERRLSTVSAGAGGVVGGVVAVILRVLGGG